MKKLASVLSVLIFFSLTARPASITALPDTGILSFRFKNINFLKDNEYANPITEGYTLLGFLIQPSFVYSPFRNLTIALGAEALSYSGTDKLTSPKLIFSTSYKFWRSSTIMLGTLDGSDRHRMDDPHFYSERLYTAHTETGLRLFTETDHFFNDIWVDWLNFIFKGDTTREEFNIGESFKYTSGRSPGGLSLEVPVQFITRHYGGQISNYAPARVETFFNGSLGLKMNYDIGNGLYGRVSLEYQQFGFRYVSKYGTFGIKSGNASWFRVQYTYKSFRFGSYYWKGHDYYAPSGNPIYSSVSDKTEGVIIPDRSIWTSSVSFTFHPASFFEILAGIDGYYNLAEHHLDGALTLHLRFDQIFRIAKLNP